MRFDPAEDGITHINIYSKGQTKLGRYLSNWADHKIDTQLGPFRTIEGLIFYMGSFDERLRKTTGFESKELGEQIDRGIRLPDDVFKRIIKDAMRLKLVTNGQMLGELFRSTLPLTHYYVYGKKVIEIPKWQWQVDEWERLRKIFQP